MCDAIEASGYGLTLGVGNVYVNHDMIGAFAGSQPFGGSGLSGTGPKAGGPHYLSRFLVEQTVNVNTAAAGGDAALMAARRKAGLS